MTIASSSIARASAAGLAFAAAARRTGLVFRFGRATADQGVVDAGGESSV